mmetsp:Transcript_145283/g.253560  ORF Transcript_145283/g.253560 Transcript_145283/m.253560 type:complete len:259 (-) Transcript_145283:75-851(-)
MAGQPVASPFGAAQPGPGIGGAADLQFYSGSTPSPNAGNMGVLPPQSRPMPGVQPPPGNFPPAGSFQAPGSFPAPQNFPPPSCDDDFENEPPILEELGINPEHIWQRMQGIAFFKRLDEGILQDLDLSGPFVILLVLAACLVLSGKFIGGHLFGLSLWGCLFIFSLINVMSQKSGIDMYSTFSILLYGLIPIDFLAFVGIFISLKGKLGAILSMVCICWATATSSRFFATAISMHQQRWLVAYPVGLWYTTFVLLTVF